MKMNRKLLVSAFIGGLATVGALAWAAQSIVFVQTSGGVISPWPLDGSNIPKVNCTNCGGGVGSVTEVDTSGGVTGGPIVASGTVTLTNLAETSHQWLDSVIAGSLHASQPACSDISTASTGCSTTVGTMATQNANNVAITGGTITGVTGLGTVTSVATGSGLTGGPITTTGAVDLANVSAISNQWVDSVVANVLHMSQPAFTNISGIATIAQGGTGQTTYTDGQVLVGDTGTTGLDKATLTAGSGVTITNGAGAITIAATGSGGTVTSVATGAGLTGGTITATGTIDLANVAATSHQWFNSIISNALVKSQPAFTDISGTATVGQGGTGQTSYTDGQLLIGNSTGNTLAKGTITAGSGVTVTNGSGTITIAATGSGGTVTTTGSPASGNLTKFSGATSIVNGDLSGDCTTSGTLVVTCSAQTTSLATGTSVSLTAPHQYYVCTGTCTVTPPVPSAGYEFCVLNDDNVATVITLAAIGSSARYETTARTSYGTAGTGTMVSSGVAGDKVCIVGRDATHYLTTAFTGTWTVN